MTAPAVESFAHLLAYAQGDPLTIFNTLVAMSWVADGFNESELEIVGKIWSFADDDESVALAFLAKPWVADGFDEDESEILEDIRWIADNDQSVALKVLALPFLDAIESGDGAAVETLAHMAIDAEGKNLPVFSALIEKSWVSDGLDGTEQWVLRSIRSIADSDESAALRILDLPFLETIETADGHTLDALNPLVVHRQGDSLQVFDALIAKSWVPDGLNEAELGVVSDIRWIADSDEDAALRVLGMPFLDVVQTPDKYAMAALNGMARHSRDHSLRLMEHPLIGGGISDRTARIVSILPHFVNRDEPDWDLVDALLEPDNDLLEERTITLPLAGEVDLALIRTTPGSERNMGYLEHAVRVNEEFTGVPFPTDYVAVLFADIPGTGGGGAHYGTHIVAGPLHDNGGDEYVTTYSHGLLAHETAHYYWRYGKIWINEGAASFMTEISQLARIGRFWRDHFVLCSHVDTIAELDAWSPSYGEIGSSCHYALGERLFMDLYRELGDSEFRKGFRNLYLLTQIQGDECEGTNLTVCHLRVAYIHDADEEAAAIAERVIARWYDGTEPYAPADVSSSQTLSYHPLAAGFSHLCLPDMEVRP